MVRMLPLPAYIYTYRISRVALNIFSNVSLNVSFSHLARDFKIEKSELMLREVLYKKFSEKGNLNIFYVYNYNCMLSPGSKC